MVCEVRCQLQGETGRRAFSFLRGSRFSVGRNGHLGREAGARRPEKVNLRSPRCMPAVTSHPTRKLRLLLRGVNDSSCVVRMSTPPPSPITDTHHFTFPLTPGPKTCVSTLRTQITMMLKVLFVFAGAHAVSSESAEKGTAVVACQTGAGCVGDGDFDYDRDSIKGQLSQLRDQPRPERLLWLREALEATCRMPVTDSTEPRVRIPDCCALFDLVVGAFDYREVWDAILLLGRPNYHQEWWKEAVHVLGALTSDHALRRGVSPFNVTRYLYVQKKMPIYHPTLRGRMPYAGAQVHGVMWQTVLTDLELNAHHDADDFWRIFDANTDGAKVLELPGKTTINDQIGHGVGHAAFVVAMRHSTSPPNLNDTAADARPDSLACQPLRRGSVPISIELLARAEATCAANAVERKRLLCSDGLFHHTAKYAALSDTPRPWFWPCDQVRYPTACFVRLLSDRGPSPGYLVRQWYKEANLTSSKRIAFYESIVACKEFRSAPAVEAACVYAKAFQLTYQRWILLQLQEPLSCSGVLGAHDGMRHVCVDGVIKGLTLYSVAGHGSVLGHLKGLGTDQPRTTLCKQIIPAAGLKADTEIKWCLARFRYYEGDQRHGSASWAPRDVPQL